MMATVLFRSTQAFCAIVWAFLLTPHAAYSADESAQRTRLTLVMRQLDSIERMAKHSSVQPRVTPSRYHFDYERLHHDIQRVRQGIQDYLSPPRAQPRDVVELVGGYRNEQEPSP
ncbi:raqprd family integrative conjugative element protein [Pseudomonas sp. FW305-3-2-15-A-LB2]|nr:raqprd family integrative conjugative element protein [Pseudomonas sp. FW305-3-2-15-C-TSA2]PMV29301.1 raqprd family integrative conjugative element protein [Pseudomonas sp. DP16D-L5]PMV39204.1 raqprd family integrative conjugative element protein [Pseudomonas sp. FW305-3-2-15-A-LB2]PMV45514.1 raqprd family integrative conjugative element protein [Pseudomonas sp. FW305-3-2-15-C-R2A1]PMV52043.1 raqprd family integrative conjugative element protein [Pseudomonas sp. FW305-3-2-15-C-LB1]PMV57190.